MYIDIFGVLWLLTIIWTWYDIDQLRKAGVNVGSVAWPLCVLLIWIIAFPMYLFYRSGYWAKAREIASRAEKREVAKRFNCPECGESIAASAKHCRFCQAIISDKDRPRSAPIATNMRRARPSPPSNSSNSFWVFAKVFGYGLIVIAVIYVAKNFASPSKPTPRDEETARIRSQNETARALNEQLAREQAAAQQQRDAMYAQGFRPDGRGNWTRPPDMGGYQAQQGQGR